MDKQKLFLDMDGVVLDSVTAYTSTYNILYNLHPNFIPADPAKNRYYDFHEICPLEKNPLHIFSHSLFFNKLEFMPNANEIIKELCEKFQVIICSLGCFNNISLKSQWIKENMPYIKDAILLTNQGIKMDKSIVNMRHRYGDRGSIFIDDLKSCLDSSNAERKILFGERFDWNREWVGEWGRDWIEVGEMLL